MSVQRVGRKPACSSNVVTCTLSTSRTRSMERLAFEQEEITGHQRCGPDMAVDVFRAVRKTLSKGMVSHPMTSSRDSAQRRCQAYGVSYGDVGEGD